MGVSNRQRRRAKRQKHDQAKRTRPPWASAERPREGGRNPEAEQDVVRGAVLAAAETYGAGSAGEHDVRLAVLVMLAEQGREALVDAAVSWWLGRTVVNNYAGWIAGRAAAEVASLSAGAELATG